jgi:hypothetical protein
MPPISETMFLMQIKSVANLYGWTLHHQQPTMTAAGRWLTAGSVGFPDIVLIHPRRGLIFAELKTDKGKATAAQLRWLDELKNYAETYLWRPKDFDAIVQRLQHD